MKTRKIKNTGLEATDICFGTSALGDMPDTYGYAVDQDRAHATINSIFDGPVNFMDTSRNYGMGRSEARIGEVIRERGGLPDGFVLSTKLDRDMETGKFDASRARRSLEESLEALSLDQIPMLHLHDPEHAQDLAEITGKGGAIDELFKMKEEGLCQAVGLAMGKIEIMFPILRDWDFDTLISHNRWTILNRQADEMFDYAHEQGMAILNAAPYAGGVLAKGSAVMPRLTYQLASEASLAPVRAVEALCATHGISPGALALQFSIRDPRITSTIVGVSKPERITQTLNWADEEISDAVWEEVAALSYSKNDPEADRDYKPA
ncbi:MAG: aldo/keto reductase [Marinosulfonomonas sp.]